jgi:hypothetical protein
MRWPWVDRAELEAAESRAKHCEEQLRSAEASRQTLEKMLVEGLVRENGITLRLEKEEKERKLLLDRIVQMSGQPPLYEKPKETVEPLAAAPAQPESVAGPVEPPKMTVEQLRSDFRSQVREHKVDVDRCRARF